MFTIQRNWFREFNMYIYVVMPWTTLYAKFPNCRYNDDIINSKDGFCYSTCSLWYFILWNFLMNIICVFNSKETEQWTFSFVWSLNRTHPSKFPFIFDKRLLNKQTTKHILRRQVDGKWEWSIWNLYPSLLDLDFWWFCILTLKVKVKSTDLAKFGATIANLQAEFGCGEEHYWYFLNI